MLNRHTRITLALLAAAACMLWLLAQRGAAGSGHAAQQADAALQSPPAILQATSVVRRAAVRTTPAVQVTPAPPAAAAPIVARAQAATPDPAPEPEPGSQRPDDLTPEEQLARERERSELQARFEAEAPDGDAQISVSAQLAAALIERDLSDVAVTQLECRQSMCRATLHGTGAAGMSVVQEANALVGAVRSFEQQNWLLASESTPGHWQVEAFIAREGHELQGPMMDPTALARAAEPR